VVRTDQQAAEPELQPYPFFCEGERHADPIVNHRFICSWYVPCQQAANNRCRFFRPIYHWRNKSLFNRALIRVLLRATREVMRELKACDLMLSGVVAVSPKATALEAAKLLLESGLTGLPVLDEQNRLVGIVSEADLLRCPPEMTGEVADSNEFYTTGLASQFVKCFGRPVNDVMTKKVASVLCNTPLMAIAELLEAMRLKWVPVTERGKVVGIINRADVLRAFVDEVASPAGL
jgi:CBS-domain-containing membrane protein